MPVPVLGRDSPRLPSPRSLAAPLGKSPPWEFSAALRWMRLIPFPVNVASVVRCGVGGSSRAGPAPGCLPTSPEPVCPGRVLSRGILKICALNQHHSSSNTQVSPLCSKHWLTSPRRGLRAGREGTGVTKNESASGCIVSSQKFMLKSHMIRRQGL